MGKGYHYSAHPSALYSERCLNIQEGKDRDLGFTSVTLISAVLISVGPIFHLRSKKKVPTQKAVYLEVPLLSSTAGRVLFILLAPSVTLWSQSQLCQFLFHWGIRELCSTTLLAKLHRALSSPVEGDEWESFFETQFVIYYEKWSLLQVVWMSRMKSLKTWWRRRQVLLTSLSSSLCLGKSWKVSTSGGLERYLSKILGTEISQHLANYNNVSTEQCLEARRDLQFCRQRGRMKG